MKPQNNIRVALFVDGDNINAGFADMFMKIGRAEGCVDILRVYADATRNSGWQSKTGFRLIHAGTGKNAADLLLAIQALELALTQDIATVVIASSDGDFAHLALRLRELGRRVVGIGEKKAPERFRLACTTFREVALPQPDEAVAPASTGKVSTLDRNIRDTIARHSQNGKGMRIADLAPKMNAAFGIRISTYPERTWRAYFVARNELYDLDARGPDAHVRFKPKGFAC